MELWIHWCHLVSLSSPLSIIRWLWLFSDSFDSFDSSDTFGYLCKLQTVTPCEQIAVLFSAHRVCSRCRSARGNSRCGRYRLRYSLITSSKPHKHTTGLYHFEPLKRFALNDFHLEIGVCFSSKLSHHFANKKCILFRFTNWNWIVLKIKIYRLVNLGISFDIQSLSIFGYSDVWNLKVSTDY